MDDESNERMKGPRGIWNAVWMSLVLWLFIALLVLGVLCGLGQ